MPGKNYENSALTFEDWMANVDREVHQITGLAAADFSDWRYRDAFEDGIEPAEAAREMLTEDDLGSEMLAFFEAED